METYSMLNSIISSAPFLMMYWFVYRNWFRFDVRIAMFLFAVLYFLEYVYLSRTGISGANMAWIHLLLFAVPLTFFRKEMLTRAMITKGYIVFNRLAINGIDDYYGGIVVIGYGLALLVIGSICIFCVLITTVRIVAERKEIQYQMELQRDKYEEIRQLQDGVRELRHDLINHLAVRTISKEDVQDLIGNCRKTIEEIGKDDR